ncbi:MAG TPA: ABC transporter permease subunit, partial [Streptosporangiaceae bacterium]|nr:ABC transporter permease subunit [Streptosporangiaceae bacterium]
MACPAPAQPWLAAGPENHLRPGCRRRFTEAAQQFLLLQKIGMNDNLFGVALPEAAFSLPVTIVILRPFMRAIPGELEDAATVDGATRIRFFVRILFPLSRPALITVGILAFVTSWNTYLLPLIV